MGFIRIYDGYMMDIPYPLVNIHSLLLKMVIEIVDLLIKNVVFPIATC